VHVRRPNAVLPRHGRHRLSRRRRVAGRIVEVDPSTAISTARSCVATVQAAGELPAAPAASKKAVAPAPVVQGKCVDEPPSDDDASMDDGPAVPLSPDIREMKLYLLLVGPYPGMHLAAKTGANAMTQYLMDTATGTYFSGLPGVPLQMRVTSAEQPVVKIREFNTLDHVSFPFFYRGPWPTYLANGERLMPVDQGLRRWGATQRRVGRHGHASPTPSSRCARGAGGRGAPPHPNLR
jgi:hypothetical protein